MQIKDFEHVRAGEYPACLDVSRIEGHESYGVYAVFHVYDVEDGLRRVELRRKEDIYGLFVFRYEDMDLPAWWEDSKTVWSLSAMAQKVAVEPSAGEGEEAADVALAVEIERLQTECKQLRAALVRANASDCG
jgi:hypothetical protein